MYVEILETIEVIAYFPPGGQLRPLRFRWNGRAYKPLQVKSMRQEGRGLQRVYYFSVTSKTTDFFELSFTLEDFRWQLVRMLVKG
jgi:hypothetical protein